MRCSGSTESKPLDCVPTFFIICFARALPHLSHSESLKGDFKSNKQEFNEF